MRIGLDLDNTIIIYDRLFHTCAVERYGMPADVAVSKAAVRAWFWAQPGGNTPWTELQGIVYGTRLREAELAPGLTEFLANCQERAAEVVIVSHKTEYPALGPRVSLRDAARCFLEERGFFGELGLSPERVFFASTQAEKVAKVASLGCAAFVDDLPKVFREPGFPSETQRLLYDRSGESEVPEGVVACRSWDEVRQQVFGA